MLEKMVDLEVGSLEKKTTTEHPDASTELDLVKISLSNAKQQLKIKEKKMSSLKSEVEMLKNLQSELAEKEALLTESRRELERLRSSEAKIKNLERELEKRNDSETKLMDFMVVQTKQLEQTKIALEESKLVISNFPNSGKSRLSNPNMFSNHEADGLRSELQLMREKLCKAEEGERDLIDKVRKLREEVRSLGEAEETGKRAIEDLAVLLKEVTIEASQAKEKLSLCERETEKSRSEAAQAKFLMKSMENRYKSQLEEARKEVERERNASERLRIEIEDSNLAWSEKESMFVKCIKTAEEENVNSQRENRNLRAELSLARQAIDDLQYKEGPTASNEDLNKKEPLEKEMKMRDKNLEGKEIEKSTEMDVKKSTDNESKEIKNLKDNEEVKVLKEDSKDFKTAGDDSKDFKTAKNDSKNPKILKVHSFIDFRASNEKYPKDHRNTNNPVEKYLEDFKTAKERDLTDLNLPKDTSKNLKEEPKKHSILKTKSFAYFKITDDHKDSSLTKEKTFADLKNTKDFNSMKQNDPINPKIPKDQKDPKIPKDQKDPKINNLTKVSRNCSLNFKDTIQKSPIVNNKDPKPPQNNDHHRDDDNSIDDVLKGSIFDIVSPVSSTKSPTPRHKKSHSLTFEHDKALEDFKHEEYEGEHEQENHPSSRSRKKPLFKRFGNMLSTKSFIRRSDTMK